MAKKPPEYESTSYNGPETYVLPSATPRNKQVDSKNPRHGASGKNTYIGPDKPSEGRSDKASDRPPMSKKWVEK